MARKWFQLLKRVGEKKLRHTGSFLNMQSGKGFEFACLCTADKFNVATCRHFELSTLSLLHISFNTHLSNRFSCSIQFFQSKRALGLALRILERCLRKHRKTLGPVSTFACFAGKAFLGKPTRGAKFTKNKNDQWSSAARVSVSKCINPWYMTHSVLPFTISWNRGKFA